MRDRTDPGFGTAEGMIDPTDELLREPLVVINVGLQGFAENLEVQEVDGAQVLHEFPGTALERCAAPRSLRDRYDRANRTQPQRSGGVRLPALDEGSIHAGRVGHAVRRLEQRGHQELLALPVE